MNTSGYGGKDLKKNVDVFTNDPSNPQIKLSISGTVLEFARVEPTYARLIGQVGEDIKNAITITQNKTYPFKIVEAKARDGKEIAIDLKPFNQADTEGYILTIENRKSVAGRYADSVILTTDSTIKPTITVPVYGQIIAVTPKAENPPAN